MVTKLAPDADMLPEPWLAYYQHLRAGVERARTLRQQAQALINEAVEHEAAISAFSRYLATEMDLDGAQIDPEGRIVRNATAPAAPV